MHIYCIFVMFTVPHGNRFPICLQTNAQTPKHLRSYKAQVLQVFVLQVPCIPYCVYAIRSAMMPLASAKRSAMKAKKVAFEGELPNKFGLSGEAHTTETPTTVMRCSDLQPGQKLMQTGERRTPNTSEQRMYLMPWGEALIGVDPGTRRRLDHAVAMAWEYDHWFMRTMRTSIDAEGLIGSIGRHPLHPPIDYDRISRFQAMCGVKLMVSPLKALPFDSIPALEQCSRACYVRVKHDTGNVMGHAQKLHCTICGSIIVKNAMQCCKQCKFHMPVCGTDVSPTCFATFWKRTHKAVCLRHKLVKSTAVKPQG
jgi:hypothetical protein